MLMYTECVNLSVCCNFYNCYSTEEAERIVHTDKEKKIDSEFIQNFDLEYLFNGFIHRLMLRWIFEIEIVTEKWGGFVSFSSVIISEYGGLDVDFIIGSIKII